MPTALPSMGARHAPATSAPTRTLARAFTRIVVATMIVVAVAGCAGDPAPPAVTVPEAHPRIAILPADLPGLRARLDRDPALGHWARLEAVRDRVIAGDLDPADPFPGTGRSEWRRLRTIEGLQCLAFHALVADDTASAGALSRFLETFDTWVYERRMPAHELMPRGQYVEALAVALDWAWPLLSEEARTRAVDLVRASARELADGFRTGATWETRTPANNHHASIAAGLGLAAIALWHEAPGEAPGWLTTALDRIDEYARRAYDADGGAYEESFYAQYVLGRVLPLRHALHRLDGPRPISDARLGEIVDQLIAEILPGMEGMLPLNDADGIIRPPGIPWVHAATFLGHREARWVFDRLPREGAAYGGTSWPWILLADVDGVRARPPVRPYRVARDVGLVVRRGVGRSGSSGWGGDDALVAFTAGRRLPGTHGHSDHGSFLIHARGHTLATDSGYRNDPTPGTAGQDVGHNVVLRDGGGMGLSGGGYVVSAKLLDARNVEGLTFALADLRDAYRPIARRPAFRARRAMVIFPGADPVCVVIDDHLHDLRAHAWTFLVHGAPGSTVELPGAPEADRPGRGARSGGPPARATIAVGDAALDVVPVPVDPVTLGFASDTFDGGSVGPHPRLHVVSRGMTWQAVTVLATRGRDDRPIEVWTRRVPHGLEIGLDLPGGHPVSLTVTRGDGGALRSLDVRFDGDMAPPDRRFHLDG